jgi:hypothetical protein
LLKESIDLLKVFLGSLLSPRSIFLASQEPFLQRSLVEYTAKQPAVMSLQVGVSRILKEAPS